MMKENERKMNKTFVDMRMIMEKMMTKKDKHSDGSHRREKNYEDFLHMRNFLRVVIIIKISINLHSFMFLILF